MKPAIPSTWYGGQSDWGDSSDWHVPNGRKAIGQVYLSENKRTVSRTVHRTYRCFISNSKGAEPVVAGAYVQDESSFIHFRGKDISVKIHECDPLPSDTFSDRAACGDGVLSPFHELGQTDAFIKAYCQRCPVALECLEFGEAYGADAAGTVYGGIVFPYPATTRKDTIARQRLNLT